MRSRIGRVEPAAATGVGRAYLAYAPGDIVDDVVARGLVRRTPSTITSVRRWRAELAATRERGYAEENEESAEGISCIAVSLAFLGFPSAALSVAVPVQRLTPSHREEIVEALLALPVPGQSGA